MKNYITLKKVQAEKQERDGQAGYKIVYPDGYESWCPADVFEETAVAIPEEAVNEVHKEMLTNLKAMGKMMAVIEAMDEAKLTDAEMAVLAKCFGSCK